MARCYAGARMSAPASPRSLGKYHLIAELGHGGMADVYLAAARGPAGFSKLQVIKQLRPALAENQEVLAMFLDEARLAARLNHPNVVQTFEVEQQDEGGCFIAMEYLDGQPLDRVLRRAKKQGGLPVPMVLRVLIDTLAGLHHAHELLDYDGRPLRVVHRDVSPQNIFVTYEGQVKVVDFGIAKAANGSTETRAGVLKGKLAYMPPEQAIGGAVDARTDLFAVGVLLVEGLTGQKFWGPATDIQILHRLSSGDLPSLPADLDVPPALHRVCQRALARSPSDRYPGTAPMQADLEAALQALGGCSARDVGLHVARLFADRRTQARAVIDEQLRLLSSSAPLSLARPSLSQTMSVTAARPTA
ncbi:MAG: serine/threonine protein kinase, partial [Myxococcales bacterium]